MVTRHTSQQFLTLPKTGQMTEYRPGDDGTFQTGYPGAAQLIERITGVIRDVATGLDWPTQPELIFPGSPVGGVYQVQRGMGDYVEPTTYAIGDLVKDDPIGVGTATAGVYQADEAGKTTITANTGSFAVTDVGRYITLDTGDFRISHYVDATHVYVQGDASGHGATNGFTTFGFFVAKVAGGWLAAPHSTPASWVETFWTADAINPPDNPAVMTWNEAIDRCLALDTCGFSDWRLPNAKELYSLVDENESGSMINDIFVNSIGGNYWSSTTRKDTPAKAHYGIFTVACGVSDRVKTDACYLRPVRGGYVNA